MLFEIRLFEIIEGCIISFNEDLADEVTHTGQTWSEDDTRNLRFMDREGRTKQTNKKWAMDLIAEVPIIMVDTRIVACAGGPNPALGHPKVFMNLDNHDPVTCIYCGLRYCLREHH